MLSRRQLLAAAVPLTVSSSLEWASSTDADPAHLLLLPSEPNAVASESALGYKRLLHSEQHPFVVSNELPGTNFRYIILPGVRAFSSDFAARLRKLAAGGSWLIFESGLCFASAREIEVQKDVMADIFDFKIDGPCVAQSRTRLARTYVHYRWPLHAMVPDFSEFVSVRHSDVDAVATIHGDVIAVRRPIGRGGIVFLGSPLGPGLFAADRESIHLTSRLISIGTRTARHGFQGRQSSSSSVYGT